jgi:5-methylcytosine-specific restriction endonuclease McrA
MIRNLEPLIYGESAHHVDCWKKDECVRYYAERRSSLCDFRQRLDLVFPAPYCDDCAQSSYWCSPGLPDISPSNWRDDIAWVLGSDSLKRVRRERRKHSDFAFPCRRCTRQLRPWKSDCVYVERLELPELYSVPLCRSGQINPPKRLKKFIANLYGNRCFCCKATDVSLHIDHILPRSNGGTAVFSNLQPLCERCGQMKGGKQSEDITLVNDMLFGPFPSDSYEGLFW